MNYNYMLCGRKIDENLLQNYGFAKDGNKYIFRTNLQNGLYLEVKISQTQLAVDVFDAIFNKKYAAFSNGHSGSAIRAQVREIVENILNECTAPQ